MVATVIPRVARPPSVDELTLADTDSVRLMLRGDSVIDWHKLSFSDHEEVDRFLRLNEFDPESEDEMARLEDLRADAVDYLARAYAMANSSPGPRWVSSGSSSSMVTLPVPGRRRRPGPFR